MKRRHWFGRRRRAEDKALADWCRTHRLIVMDLDWPGRPAPLVDVGLDSLRLMLKYGSSPQIVHTSHMTITVRGNSCAEPGCPDLPPTGTTWTKCARHATCECPDGTHDR